MPTIKEELENRGVGEASLKLILRTLAGSLHVTKLDQLQALTKEALLNVFPMISVQKVVNGVEYYEKEIRVDGGSFPEADLLALQDLWTQLTGTEW
mmetsp:Transcript_7408/g.20320  ORF Transcript_7408/g.20320 Transcript_7408/m.20320 type:complete len:96 (+) Transcript_7408:68-355(+)|eukprot:CAMPEP_0194488950 /NCGR_PEP_ID=MMETSP0253-20130528/8684_1 /TAXON_ID=2966 /ORGANISM="Noctiluca scintillans" /LENGTH=95 /DNA_ID=CAMNT_0039329369 /DNA_START=60 /DNA_END=347 /DNA_ORIENTATION=-